MHLFLDPKITFCVHTFSLDPERKKESMEKYMGPTQSSEQDQWCDLFYLSSDFNLYGCNLFLDYNFHFISSLNDLQRITSSDLARTATFACIKGYR